KTAIDNVPSSPGSTDAGRAPLRTRPNPRLRPRASPRAEVQSTICRLRRKFGRLPARPKRPCRRPRTENGMKEQDTVLARVAALKAMSTPKLKEQWQALFDTPPPPYNRRFLESRLAYRIQELAYGGLKPETVRR